MDGQVQPSLFEEKAEGDPKPQAVDPPAVSPSADPPEPRGFALTLLALSCIPGLGAKGISALCSAFDGNLDIVWKAGDEDLRGILSKARVPSVDRVLCFLRTETQQIIDRAHSGLERLATESVTIIPGSDLPDALKSLPDPPRWLFVQGNPHLLYERPAVAVVGKREASPRGREAAGLVARMLSTYDITLVSGLANGIDDAAHQASLRAGTPNIAFLGHGINVWFPEETVKTRERILTQGGAVASEYLPDDHYRSQYFVARNRLQAGLADMLIPVEANPKGGTSHTVRFARQYGRPIVGIKWPGSNGIVAELEAQGSLVVDIAQPTSLQALDDRLQALMREAGKEHYELRTAEQIVLREIAARRVRPEQAERFMERLRRYFDENLGGEG